MQNGFDQEIAWSGPPIKIKTDMESLVLDAPTGKLIESPCTWQINQSLKDSLLTTLAEIGLALTRSISTPSLLLKTQREILHRHPMSTLKKHTANKDTHSIKSMEHEKSSVIALYVNAINPNAYKKSGRPKEYRGSSQTDINLRYPYPNTNHRFCHLF